MLCEFVLVVYARLTVSGGSSKGSSGVSVGTAIKIMVVNKAAPTANQPKLFWFLTATTTIIKARIQIIIKTNRPIPMLPMVVITCCKRVRLEPLQ